MKNGCNKKIIYSCDARRFDKEHCFFYENADLDHCRHKYGGRCISSEAQKHADGKGQKYPKPTEPGWYYLDKRYIEVGRGIDGGLIVKIPVNYINLEVEKIDGTWGPRIQEWRLLDE